MNESISRPQYLAVMSVARAAESHVCKDVAILIGEYARADYEEIIQHLDLSGVYETEIAIQRSDYSVTRIDGVVTPSAVHDSDRDQIVVPHTPMDTMMLSCTIKSEIVDGTALYRLCGWDLPQENMSHLSYWIEISINDNAVDNFPCHGHHFNQCILTETVGPWQVGYWLLIVRILNARMRRAAIDYLL